MTGLQHPTASSTALPTELESPRAKLVYLSLRSSAASVDELQSTLGVPKLTLYSVLRTLRERNLVKKQDGRFAVVE
ncbi:helix-turn-helix domain-containing protein [Halorussus litoreus]|uniref:helix-turn-helix domain-containing protein n=1 Tax=Halorussus litoreus TaxID=1710536 RepID=UPI001E61AA4D|nr:helix-turn-helix domain-containing protein [Halorussus litoreus]